MSKIVIDEFNSTIFSQKMGNIIYKDRDRPPDLNSLFSVYKKKRSM